MCNRQTPWNTEFVTIENYDQDNYIVVTHGNVLVDVQ